MKVLIDIPKETKKIFDKASDDDIYGTYYDYNSLIGKAIKNGTPSSMDGKPCTMCPAEGRAK